MKKIIIILVLLGSIFFASCGSKENETGVTPPPTTPSPIPTKIVLEAEPEPEPEPVEETEYPKYGLKETLNEIESTETEKRKIANLANYWYAAHEERESPMFYVDEETDTIYFVNEGNDYYLYRIKDGECKLAVEMPMKSVWVQDKVVYFMLESYGKYHYETIYDGSIFSYTPKTGEIKLLYAMPKHNTVVHALAVDDTGIYFRYSNGYQYDEATGRYNAETIGYRLSFDGELKKDWGIEKRIFPKWKEYNVLSWRENVESEKVYRLENLDTGETIILDIAGREADKCFTIGDILYWWDFAQVRMFYMNLETGERGSYDFWKEIQRQMVKNPRYFSLITKTFVDIGADTTREEFEPHLYFHAYAMTEDTIYMTGDFLLYAMDIATGDITCYLNPDRGPILEYLYTDGTNLYSLYGGNMVQVVLPETWNANETPTWQARYLIQEE